MVRSKIIMINYSCTHVKFECADLIRGSLSYFVGAAFTGVQLKMLPEETVESTVLLYFGEMFSIRKKIIPRDLWWISPCRSQKVMRFTTFFANCQAMIVKRSVQ